MSVSASVSASVRCVLKRLIAVAAAALTLAAPAQAGVPNVRARAFFVVDGTTGEVLAQHAAGSRLPIASITKLMTVLVTLEHSRLADLVTVQRDAAEVGESTIHLRAGERISVRDLLAGALIQSANDAADALADYVGHGNDRAFVALMNTEAKRLGLPVIVHSREATPQTFDVLTRHALPASGVMHCFDGTAAHAARALALFTSAG